MQNNCVTLNCPYIFMCKEYHLHRERGERCEVRDTITEIALREAQNSRISRVSNTENHGGESLVSIVKRVMQCTGCGLREAHEACQKTGYVYADAISYISSK